MARKRGPLHVLMKTSRCARFSTTRRSTLMHASGHRGKEIVMPEACFMPPPPCTHPHPTPPPSPYSRPPVHLSVSCLGVLWCNELYYLHFLGEFGVSCQQLGRESAASVPGKVSDGFTSRKIALFICFILI